MAAVRFTKTAVFWIIISVSILVAAICLVSWLTVMRGFNRLEQRIVQRNIERAQEAVADRLRMMIVQLTDWGFWDDTCSFIEDRNSTYITANFPANILDTLKVDVVVFIDLQGKIVFARNSESATVADADNSPLPDGFSSLIGSGSRFIAHTDESSAQTGIMILPHKLMLVASRPILPSTGKGRIRGTVVFAKFLDKAEMKRLSEIVKVVIDIKPAAESNSADGLSNFKPENGSFIEVVNEDLISGFTRISSVAGLNDLILRVSMPREISSFGLNVMHYFNIALVVVGLIFGITVYIPLDREISRRRLAEKQLIKLKNRFERVAECSRETIWEIDATGMHTYISQSVKDSLGYEPDEIIGKKSFFDLHPQEGRDEFRSRMLEIFAQKQFFRNMENCVLSKDGRKVWLVTNGLPVLDEKGELAGYCGSDFDISRRKEIEARLLEAKEAAEEATRAKSSFLANMSHEIRTPMNAVLGFTDLLEETSLSAKQAEYLNIIKTSGQLLLEIINNILDVSKFESGRFVLEEIDFSLDRICVEALRLFIPKLENNDIEAYIRIHPEIPASLKGDPTRLQQVLVNLVGNASKFTRRGSIGIEILSDVSESADGRVSLLVHVVDTGIGIPADKFQMIFQPFTQVDATTTRKYGGTGLGLPICMAIVNACGGSIRVESEEGRGSDFIFTLKLRTSEADPAERPRHLALQALEGRRIMIVSDRLTRGETLRFYCEGAKMKVCGVYTSCEAAEDAIRRGFDGGNPELIILGMHSESAAEFELVAGWRSRGIGIAVMGGKFRSAKDASARGFAALIPALFTRDELYQALASAVGHKESEESYLTFRHHQDDSCSGIRVLIAEDDASSRKLFNEYLQILGCEWDFVGTGQEAVDRLKEKTYDLCLMDVQMPVMDGLTATAIIRREISPDLPVIALSASVLQEDQLMGNLAGMNHYITKPVSIGTLQACIERFTGRKKG